MLNKLMSHVRIESSLPVMERLVFYIGKFFLV